MTDESQGGVPPQEPTPEPPQAQPSASPPPNFSQTASPPDPYGLGTTSIGMSPNIAAGLGYLIWIAALIFFLVEKENKFIKFHAFQALVGGLALSIPLWILWIVLMFIPVVGWIIGILLWLGFLAYWIYMIIMAFTGKWTKIPVIGDIAAKQVGL